ncbi:hypothetical protein [Ralstonia pseudosolanacearum]|uniref:hypothetical protein n=1 Tax=Ralstonia pseudosolanacearum TaxID=1310165 RepID=UPI003CF33427
MQQPSDVACNLACATMRDVGRTAEFFLDAQIEYSRLRLKIAEAALEDVREMERELGNVHDWTSLAATQSMFAKMQSSHSATALQTWIDFMNNLQAAYLRQVTEWNDQMQRPQEQNSSAQLIAASADSLRAFFDSFNLVGASDSEAKRKAMPRHAMQAKSAHAT